MYALIWAFAVIAASSASGEIFDNRLPGDILPEFYGIRILTNIADMNENYTFGGDVRIKVNVVNNTNKIFLHSRELTINESNVRVVKIGENTTSDDICKSDGKPELKLTNQTYHPDLDYYIIHVEEDLEAGQKYAICIPFEGKLTPGLAGFYRSSYKNLETGETKWLAVTQFESTDARRAFPCFDEPGMKARFEVTLGHIKSKSAVSNMPLLSTEPIKSMEGWVWDRFQVTVPMSTYLVAFMVTDLEYEPSPRVASNNVAFRVWARKDAVRSGQVKFAAEIGPKVLEDYEKYFNIKYPLPKQDMVAVPDFSAGAMENWGLITYRETALLFDPKFSSSSAQPHIVSVIAHEIAHQWFGNLVTMRWWTDLWLNEGFATYMATQEVHKLFPEWNHLEENMAENQLSVLNLDSLKSSHPISLPIGHPREIAEIFDVISYQKGSAMLRMINRFLGEETFRAGVSKYLKRHAYNNAEQDDLWAALTEQAHQDGVMSKDMNVKDIMDTWTLQTGYPVLRVTRDYKKGEATVHQERFLAEGVEERSVDNTTWWVPITYTTASELNFTDTSPRAWIPAGQREIVLSGLNENDWILLNVQLSGLNRINYDRENWNKLSAMLKSDQYDKISLLNRVQLIDDSLSLAKSGDLDYSVPLNILQYLKSEKEYAPWRTALVGIGYLDRMLKRSTLYGPFKSYMKSLIGPIYNTTSNQEYEDIPSNLQKINLQSIIMSWACKLNMGDCRAKAVHFFRQWMASPNPDQENPVPKDFRSICYCNAIKEGSEEEWNFAWKRYLNSNVGAHQTQLLQALACTREPWLLNRYLRWAIDESSGIRRQDSRTVFGGVSRNDLGYFLAKTFFTENIADVYKHHGTKTARLSSYIRTLTQHVTSQSELDEYIAFTKKNSAYLAGANQSVQQALEAAKINVQWQKQFFTGMSKLLVDPSENIIGKV